MPAGDLWNKITAGPVRALGDEGSPQSTEHPLPAGKQGQEPGKNTLDATSRACRSPSLPWAQLLLQDMGRGGQGTPTGALRV